VSLVSIFVLDQIYMVVLVLASSARLGGVNDLGVELSKLDSLSSVFHNSYCVLHIYSLTIHGFAINNRCIMVSLYLFGRFWNKRIQPSRKSFKCQSYTEWWSKSFFFEARWIFLIVSFTTSFQPPFNLHDDFFGILTLFNSIFGIFLFLLEWEVIIVDSGKSLLRNDQVP